MLLLTILLPCLCMVAAFELESETGGFDVDEMQRDRRSPEPFVDRGGRRGGYALPPGVNPTFPKNGGQWPDAYKQRGRRSPEPEPFVDRSSSMGRRPGPGFSLPQGVNPTFPKNGGQWPDAYKQRVRRSPIPNHLPRTNRDGLPSDRTSPTFPKPKWPRF